MKKGTLLAIGTFVLLLVAVLATRESGTVSEGMPTLHLPALDSAAITGVEVTGAATATLKKDGDHWTVLDPAAGSAPHLADEVQVNNLLSQLKSLKAGAYVTDKADRQAELEVDAAKGLNVKVLGSSGILATLTFGKAAKAGGSYLRVGTGNEVFTTPSPVGRLAHRDAKSWRKRSFFPGAAADLAAVTTTFEDGSTVGLEAVDGGWSLTAGTSTPADYRFDPGAAGRVVNTLAGLSASDFADSLSDATAGFGVPHSSVKVQKKDGTTVALQFAHPQPTPNPDGGAPIPNAQVAVKVDGDPQLYLVAPFQADAILKKVGDLRDLSLLSFDPNQVTRVAIHASANVTLAKAAGAWSITEPKALPAGFDFDPTLVTGFLMSLKSMRAVHSVDGVSAASAGLAKPTASVDVTLEGGTVQHLAFGSEIPGSAGQSYVTGAQDKVILAMPSSAKARFDRGIDLFKRLPRPPPGARPGAGATGLDQLPPDIRAKIEAQLRQQGQQPH